MVLTQDIVRTLQTYWRQQGFFQTPTLFPGVPTPIGQADAWFEFWVSTCQEPVHREISPTRLFALVDIHCFSRKSNNRQQLHSLIDSARLLSGIKLEVQHEDTAAALIRLDRPQVRDLSRTDQEHNEFTVLHAVVSLTAIIEEFASTPAV